MTGETLPVHTMTDEELWNSPLGERLRHYADKLLTAEAERIRINSRRKTDGVVAEGLEFARAIVSPLGDPNSMLSDADKPTRADTDPWAQWHSPERTGLREVVEAAGPDREAAQEAAKAYIASLQGDERPAADEEREEREDALPKWAQQKLNLYRRRLADERTASAQLRGDIGETDTLIRHYERPDHRLPRRAEITFLPDPARPDYAIECAMRDGALHVHGSTGLVIRPRVTNDFTVELEK